VSEGGGTVFPRRHPDTAFRKIGDEGGLVVLPGRAEVKVLNPVGIAVYALLDGTRDLDALSQAIAEQFDVEPDTARRDVEAFVADLRRAGMIEEAGTPAGRPA
jgi:hypothetical protein